MNEKIELIDGLSKDDWQLTKTMLEEELAKLIKSKELDTEFHLQTNVMKASILDIEKRLKQYGS